MSNEYCVITAGALPVITQYSLLITRCGLSAVDTFFRHALHFGCGHVLQFDRGRNSTREVPVEQRQDDNNNNDVPASITWLFAIALVLALAVFGVGMYLAANDTGFTMLAAGCVSVIGVLIAWPLGKGLYDARCGDQIHQQELITTLRERLEQLSIMLNMM